MKQTTFVLIASLVFTSYSALGADAETAMGAGGGHQVNAGSSLPLCVNEPSTLLAIHDWERANALPKQSKYKEMQKQLSTDSDDQLMTRLVYAESIAANCSENQDKLLNPIASVIANRVAKNGDVKSIVFARNQFASSLNFYPGSKPTDFLCPQDDALWKKAWAAVQKAKAQKFLSANAGHYYLYLNMAGTPPDWAKPDKVPVPFSGSDSVAKCFKVFPGGFQ